MLEEMAKLRSIRELQLPDNLFHGVARKVLTVYRNPDNDLPIDFSQNLDIYYEALHQPTEAKQFIEQIKEDMCKALRSLDEATARILNKVKLLPNRKKLICLSPLDP